MVSTCFFTAVIRVRILARALKFDIGNLYVKVPQASNRLFLRPLNVLSILYCHQPVHIFSKAFNTDLSVCMCIRMHVHVSMCVRSCIHVLYISAVCVRVGVYVDWCVFRQHPFSMYTLKWLCMLLYPFVNPLLPAYV